jgi:hypothetical protein
VVLDVTRNRQHLMFAHRFLNKNVSIAYKKKTQKQRTLTNRQQNKMLINKAKNKNKMRHKLETFISQLVHVKREWTGDKHEEQMQHKV